MPIEISKQDILNEQYLRIALYQACNFDLPGSSRKAWFVIARNIHKARSKEYIAMLEGAFQR